MIDLEQTENGLVLPVHAQPRARKNGVSGVHGGRLRVAVTQAPEKGKANDALRKVLADELGIRLSQVALISGETSARKRFLLSGVSPDSVRDRIAALCDRNSR